MQPVIASVGTLHPWNVAGAGLDLRAAADLDIHVVTALAAVSAQGAEGVHGVYAVAPRAFVAQLEALPWTDISAVRVGAMPDAASHDLLADVLRGRAIPIVVDPVLVASTGGALANGDARAAAAGWFADPRAIVTPNRSEAESFLREAISNPWQAVAALAARGARAVVLKGGHFDGDSAIDYVAEGSDTFEVRSPRRDVDMRGTGCLFALALAAHVARGARLREAVAQAHAFVQARIAHARPFAGFTVAY